MKKIFMKTLALLSAFAVFGASSCGGDSQPAGTASAPVSDNTQSESQDSSLTYPVTVITGYSTNEEDPRGVVLKSSRKPSKRKQTAMLSSRYTLPESWAVTATSSRA